MIYFSVLRRTDQFAEDQSSQDYQSSTQAIVPRPFVLMTILAIKECEGQSAAMPKIKVRYVNESKHLFFRTFQDHLL
jgi:hypothetical protein